MSNARKQYYTGPGYVPRRTKSRYCSKMLPPLLPATQDYTAISASQSLLETVNLSLREQHSGASLLAASDDSSVWDSQSDENSFSEGDSSDALSESNTDDLNNDEPIYFEPLFQGSDISTFDYHVRLKEFALKHHITKQAYQDLLILVSATLPSPNQAVTSYYRMQKYFNEVLETPSITQHHYCSECHHLFETDEDQLKCPNKCTGKVNRFILCDIAFQIKKTLSDISTWDVLQSRFDTDYTTHEVLSDVYCGTEYKKLSSPGEFLSNSFPANVSFCMNTDGVSLFRSSQTEIWPLWLVINELPPHMRFSRKHMILGGVWFSTDKPTMSTYMKPFVEKINDMFFTGVDVETPDGIMQSHAMILMCTADLPAKAKVANHVQYNGYYACLTCNQMGVRVGRTMCYPFNMASCSELRKHETVLEHCKEAAITGQKVFGAKGIPILAMHPPFNLVLGMVIDVMHCVYLGVVKSLLHMWFSAPHRHQEYSIISKVSDCDDRLLAINVPDVISRPPKTLLKYNKWKASELQSWLLYYSLPVLKGVLPECYFNHYSLLVLSIYILLSSSISQAELQVAESCLHHFYESYSSLYGCASVTMNVHMLSHLALYVKAWGPLWTMSCFSFESMNGVLKGHFHGTRDMSIQLMENYMMSQLLSRLQSEVKLKFSTSADIVSKKWKSIPGNHLITNNVVFKGREYRNLMSEDEMVQLICQQPGLMAENCKCTFFSRAIIGQELYHSRLSKARQQNNYTVLYTFQESLNVGEISCFVNVHLLSGHAMTAAVITPFEKIAEDITGIHTVDQFLTKWMMRVRKGNPNIFIAAQDIKCKCIAVTIGTECYIAKFPNNLYRID